jgi:phosphoglycolate phosphatase-like HAD superfamily hydrolase
LTEVIGAEDAVDHVVSKGDVERSKPEPDIFAVAVEQAELDSDRTIVVGDTPWDVEAASKIGLDTICVLTGGHTREKLEEAGAVAVYEDAADLLAHLDDSPIGKLLG